MELFKFNPGSIPVLISMPHNGTLIPDELRPFYTANGLAVEDTDWYMDELYGFGRELGCAMLESLISRYVIDLNRSPQNENLYPGQTSSMLCPATSFTGESLYINKPPNSEEIKQRLSRYYQPYHDQLNSWIQETLTRYKIAVLYEAHSVKSQLPRLFEGQLPELNLGTNCGQSCKAELKKIVWAHLQKSSYTSVQNERFNGGYITRHYGQPENGIHTLQMEISQRCYMNESSLEINQANFQKLQIFLKNLITSIINWTRQYV
ncbi:MAG: N-formylglutamate deformylase [Lentisphaerales bacterium]|nr:N-formylglutamate deformylase [Lentisphaerales bacterium]